MSENAEKEPLQAEDALWEAEDICYRRVLEILGLTDGVDAFISTNGGRYDCAVFDIGSPKSGEVFGFPASKFHWRGRLELYSRNRRLIQKWIMRLLLAMPIGTTQPVASDLATDTIVEVFRIAPQERCIDEITTVELKAKKDADGVAVFTTSVEFDIVFTVGARSPAN